MSQLLAWRERAEKAEARIAKAIEILLWAPFNDNNRSESALIAIARAKKALEEK